MHLVTGPFRAAFLAIACVGVIRRTDQQRRGWQIVGNSPADGLVIGGRIKLLNPHLTEDLHRRKGQQFGRVLRCIHLFEHLEPIGTDLLGQGIPRWLGGR